MLRKTHRPGLRYSAFGAKSGVLPSSLSNCLNEYPTPAAAITPKTRSSPQCLERHRHQRVVGKWGSHRSWGDVKSVSLAQRSSPPHKGEVIKSLSAHSRHAARTVRREMAGSGLVSPFFLLLSPGWLVCVGGGQQNWQQDGTLIIRNQQKRHTEGRPCTCRIKQHLQNVAHVNK